MLNLSNELKSNAYPGRGIVIGRSEKGSVYVAYFIMGRSENSRNRVFVEDGEGIRTKAFDPSKMADPSLIIYAPVRTAGGVTIVTNGDQTDTIFEAVSRGGSFESALRTREFEPDDPNFTPRISGIVYPSGDFSLSIIKSDDGDSRGCRRFFYEYSGAREGAGYFIHTYKCDGNPIPSFEGEPKKVAISGTIGEFCESIWQNLNADNKVSLFAREIDGGKTVKSIILNKNR